ncbi:methyl-CpG-binding domain protein 5-like isoform X2 [Rhinatrema bivittatum]|uniref:methyl-CpG-binding domain protein 5-like isoform X2 n=1 Tax=Rhinatrema bivittatum TaxID=194408 RepID=UPI00112D9765|nr:methyl-CpG-binding domain protein 5-like isoform X2 [Rhinatrema bivittatum]
MNGGSESGGADRDRTPEIQVPVGWQRKVQRGMVLYLSPSGTTLTSLDQIRTYLLTDGTCKCGLECPLKVHKVFNFDVAAAVKRRSAEDVKAEEDMTKLCNHRRKIVAMATLYKSMEAPPLTLQGPTAGYVSNQVFDAASRTLDGGETQQPVLTGRPSNTENDVFTRLMMAEQAGSLARPHRTEKSADRKLEDAYISYSGERYSNAQPVRGSLLTRRLGTTVGDTFAPRNYATVPANGNRDPLSRSDPAFPSELYCLPHGKSFDPSSKIPPYSSTDQDALDSSPRSSFPVHPCNFPLGHDFSAKVQRSLEEVPHSCPERDPLGILDSVGIKLVDQRFPCPNAPASQLPAIHMEPSMLSNNRTSPLARLGHDPQMSVSLSRTSTLGSPLSTTLSSISSPGGSMEMSPQRSRHSSTSSEHGTFILGGHFTAGKPLSRSPMPLGSPKVSVPPSPKAIFEGLLHQGKDNSSSLAVGNALIHQSNNPPPVSSGAMHEKKNQSGILGMSLSQILHQQNVASFPASSLLSAAAKAQLASQKRADGGNDTDAPSTLQSQLTSSNALLSMVSAQSNRPLANRLSSQPGDTTKGRRQRRSPTVLRLLKESHPSSSSSEEAAMKKGSAKNLPPAPNVGAVLGTPWKLDEDPAKSKGNPHQSLSSSQPLSSLLTFLSAQSSPTSGSTNCSVTTPLAPHPANSSSSFGGASSSPFNSCASGLPLLGVPLSPSFSPAEGASCQSTSASVPPAFQDFNSQLLSLFGQLASADQTSGSPSQPKFPGPASGIGLRDSSSSTSQTSGKGTASQPAQPSNTKTASASSPAPNSSPDVSQCPLPSTGEPFPFLTQEQVLPFGSPVPAAGLLAQSFLASLSLAVNQQLLNQSLLTLLSTSLLGQNEMGLGSLGFQSPAPELESQALLAASLLQGQCQPPLLPLCSLSLPQLDFLQQQNSLLSSPVPLPALQESPIHSQSDPREKTEPLVSAALGEGFSDSSLLFPALSIPPALMALNSALLAAGLASSESGAGLSQPCSAASSAGSTSSITTSTTDTPVATTEGKAVTAEVPGLSQGTTTASAAISGRLTPLLPPLASPLLGAALLGDLSALAANTCSTPPGALLGAGPLLAALQSPLGLQLFQNQAPSPGQLTSPSPLPWLSQNLQPSNGPALERQVSTPGTPLLPRGTSPSPSPSLSLGHQPLDRNQNLLGRNNFPAAPLPLPCTDAARKVQNLVSCLSHLSPSLEANTTSALDYSSDVKPLRLPEPEDITALEENDCVKDRVSGSCQQQSLYYGFSSQELESGGHPLQRSPLKRVKRATRGRGLTKGLNGDMRSSKDTQLPASIKSSENELSHPHALKCPAAVRPAHVGRARGRRPGTHFNGQQERPKVEGPSVCLSHPAWRCNGEVSFHSTDSTVEEAVSRRVPEQDMATDEILGSLPKSEPSLEMTEVTLEKLKPLRRGRKRNQHMPRMSTRLDGMASRWAGMGPSVVVTNTDRSLSRLQRPGRPAKNKRRRLLS